MELQEALDKLSAAGMITEGCCGDKDKKNCDGKCSCGKEGCKGECGKDKKKKKKKEIEEALDILAQSGLVAESYWSGSRPETRYGNRTGVAGYTFRGAKPERKYVKILICLRDGEKTKAEVHKELGMPDPTSKEQIEIGRASCRERV